MTKYAIMALALLFTGCSATGHLWSTEHAKAHTRRYNNPGDWELDRLKGDAERAQLPALDYLKPLPFPHIAFPAPTYADVGWDCPGLGVSAPSAPDGMACGAAWVCGDTEGTPDDPVCAILAAGPEPLENIEQWCISRSHPHYLYQGTFRNTHGEIDWVAVRMADGTELAIINGRIVDLGQGNVILVRQMADGSLRFRQSTAMSPPGDYPGQWDESIAEVLRDPQNSAFLGGKTAPGEL